MTISIKQVKVGELKPAAYNPRKWSEKATRELKDSIESFGLVDPIICNQAPGRENVVIGGHFRLHVAKQLGYAEVPVVYISVPDVDKEKELNIRLNKNSGDFDLDLLKNFDADLLARIGFESAELDKIFQEPPTDADDAVPDVPEKPKSKLGDIYLLGRHRVMCGDSTSRDDVARLMDGKRAALLHTDPPYGIKRSEGFEGSRGFGGSGKPIKSRRYEGDKWDEQRPPKECFEMALSIADRAIIWGGNFFSDYLPQGKHWIVWDKNNTMPTFGDAELAWTNIERESVKIKRFTYNGLIGKEKERFHPTQKSMSLIEEVTVDYSKKDDIIVDLFLGSGTTLIACEKTNRVCYGMELDPKYVDVIVKRWEDFTGQKAEKI